MNDIEHSQDKYDIDKQLANRKTYTPYFTYVITLVQIMAFSYTLKLNNDLTGEFIQSLDKNIMVGPSASTLISAGARFVPCMKPTTLLTQNLQCPSISNPFKTCTLEELCQFGGFNQKSPDQWFRFIYPIFFHGGLLHIVFNLMFQVKTGADLEKDYGPVRMFLIYFVSGFGGFVFGASFTSEKIPSVGASGSLYGLVGCLLLEIVMNWKLMKNPTWELTKLLGFIILTFAIGLIPQIDNFSHIGGFVCGILTGLAVIPTIHFSKLQKRVKMIVRVVAGVLVLGLLITGLSIFYSENPQSQCEWCTYLNCIPSLFDCSQITGGF
jgi:membrane associated rhomboid family serine protease